MAPWEKRAYGTYAGGDVKRMARGRRAWEGLDLGGGGRDTGGVAAQGRRIMTGVRVSSSYGIDAGDGFTAVVRAARSPRGPVFTTVAAVGGGGGDDAALRAAAAEATLAAARRTALVAAALPARDSVVRRIAVPLASVARARRVLPSLLDVQLPFRLEDCACAFPEIRRTSDGRVAALAAAAPRVAVERRLAGLREAGFDPMILDAEAVALWDRALAEHPVSNAGVRVVACLAPDRLVLVIGRGADLESVVTLREALRAPGADGGGEDWTVALQRARQALGTGGTAEWIWTGPSVAEGTGLLEAFERDLGAGCEVRWFRAKDPATFLARALAARALAMGTASCNLRSGDLAHPGLVSWDLSAGRRAAVLCIVAGLTLAAFNVAVATWIGRREAAVQQRLEAEARRVGRLSAVQRGQELRMARDSVARRRTALAPVTRMFEPSVTPQLAGVLRVARAASLAIEVVELGDGGVRVQGTSPDRDACSRLEDVLRLQGYRPRIRRGDEPVDGRVAFTLEGDRP